jgi:superfamily II DNA or RNA helicase
MNKDLIQKQAIEAIKKDSGTLVLGTGVGKTLTALKHLEQFLEASTKILVVAPKLSVFKSWDKEIVTHKKEYLTKHITYVTYRSLKKLNLSDFDIIYFDECHNLLPHHYDFIKTYSRLMIGLTGTPPNEGGKKTEMFNKYLPIRFEYLIDDAIEDNLINDYKIIVHYISLDKNLNVPVKTKTGKTFYTSEYKTLLYWNRKCLEGFNSKSSIGRLSALKSFKTKQKYALDLASKFREKTILFANNTEQADILCKYSYHSKNPKSLYNLELFNTGKITKLSCVEQISEGINIIGLKQGILLHSYSGQSSKGRQKLGRLLRLNPNDTATLHLLCYKDTVDINWVNSLLEHLDYKKIKYFDGDTMQYCDQQFLNKEDE